MTYGPDVRGLYRSLARYTDRILRGTTPADLPIEVPTKFYLANQSEDGQGARPYRAADTARPR
jgi:hypothetical protein